MNITLSKNDEIVMKLLHYFITEKGYNPIVLHGAKDEIWLENNESDYKIVRIVSSYIHNDEQLNFDIFRTRQILKRIKTKMFSFKIDTLSIFVNLGDNVNLKDKDFNNIKCADVKDINDISKYPFIINTFPNIIEVEKTNKEGLDLFIKLTDDINRKNLDESKKVEDVFSKKTPIVTYIIMIICAVLYLMSSVLSSDLFDLDPNVLYKLGGLVNTSNFDSYVDFYRVFTSMFLHASLIHFLMNMYSLYVIGPQLESFYGKVKYTIIFIFSGIIGNLLSLLFIQDNIVSVGASGAIFGLLGSLLYFGYYYRVYLSGVIKSQIIPLIILNLGIGFLVSGINNFAHIGGLIGGVLISIAVGVKYKGKTSDRVNGIIMSLILVASLLFMILK